eukprot:Em0020g774a
MIVVVVLRDADTFGYRITLMTSCVNNGFLTAWVWLSSDRANQSSMMQYAQDYLDHGIQVGAVDLDMGWSTANGDFNFDTTKYPNATEMVEFFHSKGIRVILWVTSAVDTDSPNFQEAYDNGYFIRDIFGKQSLFKWWHGTGGLLDYTNEEAVQWWHGQIDQVLSLGIDGWKCDGTDVFIVKLVVPIGKGGVVTRKEYSMPTMGTSLTTLVQAGG